MPSGARRVPEAWPDVRGAGPDEGGPKAPQRKVGQGSTQQGNGTWPRCDPEDRNLMVGADDDQHVLGLEGADQRVVEAERPATPGDRQDDVAQRAGVEPDLAGGHGPLVEVQALAP